MVSVVLLVQSSFYKMINPNRIGMILIVAAAASIVLVTIGSQSTMATELDDREEILMADIEEDVEAGNATIMMANQTTGGNMTDVTNSTN